MLPGLRVNGRPLRAVTMNQGPPPQVRQMVVVEGWTPEPPSDSPPKEASGEEVATTEAAEDMTPESERAQAPPPEGQEGTRGAYPPPGTFSGEMVTLDMGPLALGPRRLHLTLMYEW